MLRWPDSRECFQASGAEPFLCESPSGAQKIANHSFEATRVNCSNILKIRFTCCSANQLARIAPIRVANRRAI